MASEPAPTPTPSPTSTPTRRFAVPALLGRVSFWCTVAAAVILTAVIVVNVVLLGRHLVASNLALDVLLDAGPPVGLLLSTAATYINYYGSWRILRGHEKYDVGSDLKSHAADLPKFLQHQPGALSQLPGCLPGCTSFVPAIALGVSLVATGLTLAPPPFALLGSVGAQTAPGIASTTPSATTPTVVISPTATTGSQPTNTPHAPPAGSIVSPLTYSGSCGQGTVPAQKITLDNSTGTGTLNWQVSIPDNIKSGQPWAKPNKTSGTVGPGQTDSFQLTPNGSLCSSVPPGGAVFHANVALSGEIDQTETITVTVSGSGR